MDLSDDQILNKLNSVLLDEPELEFKSPNNNDIRKIEQELTKIKPKKSKVKKQQDKGPTKLDLIDKIVQVKQANGESCDVNKMRRMTKDELLRLLGTNIDDGINRLNGVSDQQIMDDLSDTDNNVQDDCASTCQPAKQPQSQNTISIETGARSLFQLNKMLSTVLEKVSDNVLEKHTGYKLDGYSRGLDEQKEQLLELYREIYKQHSQEITRYISPINLVLMINADCAIRSIVQTESDAIKKR